MFLVGILSNCSDTSTSTKRGKKVPACEHTLQLMVLQCVGKLLAVFYVKRAVLYALIQTVNQGDCTPRTHGKRGRKPKHALMFDDVNRVVQFIMNASEEIGLPSPAAPRGKDNIPIDYIPSSTTKLHLHAQYRAACVERNVWCVNISAFKSIWLHCVPNIKTKRGRLRHVRATSNGIVGVKLRPNDAHFRLTRVNVNVN
ncbi:hypothetical protein DPMN_142295 [Dreissena polymorpha]|uniref:Uncharacterized protein n=1 Tax=Dreissena polymorpha TaxID=45954 RepID=A0A9D4GAV4_DREPO|nr:hypothetical protein DPMN_142295 [Dreissena polymorpha]